MELTGLTRAAAVIRLPQQLSPAAVAGLDVDLAEAFSGSSRLVVLAGADEETFCTGLALDGDGPIETEAFSRLLARLADAPKPTLAVVEGRAIGGGLGLAAACDWVVASEQATFALPELLWGLMPAMIWPFITARMAESEVLRWTVSATSRTAAAAVTAGLVDDLAPSGRQKAVLARTERMLLRLDPVALRRLRWWSRESRQQPLSVVLSKGAALTAEMAAGPSARARIEAFGRGEAPWT